MSLARSDAASPVVVDPRPKFDLSPGLYMQFMEPLGSTEGSIEAAWDFRRDDWHAELVRVTKELAPPLIRWPGGCFASYYRWREGVGTPGKRPTMVNLCWGGAETNRVGTHEYMEFCRRTGARALVCVNFESDGRRHWARPGHGLGVRSAGPAEAADWVDYCNDPANAERRKNGARAPFDIPLWQIGNETSYDPHGFDRETAARRTRVFAKAMRKVDPDIRLIGWGDSGWARRMCEVNADVLDYVAFHNGIRPAWKRTPLHFEDWREDPAETWKHLMSGCRCAETKLRRMRREIAGFDVKLALTECHWSLPGRHRSSVQATWAAGVAAARVLNVHSRHGDLLKIATMADFCGTSWMNNAVMIKGRRAYLMPVARVMALFRRHVGTKAVTVAKAPRDLDVTASRRGKKIFLHVANVSRTRPVRAKFSVSGMKVLSGRAFEIAEDPMLEIHLHTADLLEPRERKLPTSMVWTFPPASVSAIEFTTRQAGR